MAETPASVNGSYGLSEIARQIYLETLKEVDLGATIKEKIKLRGDCLIVAGDEIQLDGFSDIALIGFGKASIGMAEAVEALLGDRLSRGLVVTDRRHKARLKSEIIISGHPLPDEKSLEAGKRIIELLSSCGRETLLIFAISGGGSALVEWPLFPEMSLEDFRRLNQVLIECGATIGEINIVRKSLSGIKGGRLGYLARNTEEDNVICIRC